MRSGTYRSHARKIEAILDRTPIASGGFTPSLREYQMPSTPDFAEVSDPFGIRRGLPGDAYARFNQQASRAMDDMARAPASPLAPGMESGARRRVYDFDRQWAPGDMSREDVRPPAELRSYTPTPMERVEDFVARRLGRTAFANQKARDIRTLLELTPAGSVEGAFGLGTHLPNVMRDPETGSFGINWRAVRAAGLDGLGMIVGGPNQRSIEAFVADFAERQAQIQRRRRVRESVADDLNRRGPRPAAGNSTAVIMTPRAGQSAPLHSGNRWSGGALLQAGYPRNLGNFASEMKPSFMRAPPQAAKGGLLAYEPIEARLRVVPPTFGRPSTWQGVRPSVEPSFQAHARYSAFADPPPTFADAVEEQMWPDWALGVEMAEKLGLLE